MRVLVTGHRGYIGATVVPALRSAGHRVTGLDAGFFRGSELRSLTAPEREIWKDVRDVEAADLADVDAVVHLAALSNDPMGDIDPALTLEVNYRASVRLARLARDAGVSRFVFASSCSAYGAAGEVLVAEDALLQPVSPYAESKVRTEEELVRMSDSSFSPVLMRNATAYGVSPTFRTDLVLNNLVCWAHTGRRLQILSDGTPWRPLVHVRDIATACAALLAAPRAAVHAQAFNIGAEGENYRVRDLAEIIQRLVPGCTADYGSCASPDPRSYRVDFSKLQRLVANCRFAWSAESGAREMLREACAVSLTLDDFQCRYVRLEVLKKLRGDGRLDAELRWRNGGSA